MINFKKYKSINSRRFDSGTPSQGREVADYSSTRGYGQTEQVGYKQLGLDAQLYSDLIAPLMISSVSNGLQTVAPLINSIGSNAARTVGSKITGVVGSAYGVYSGMQLLLLARQTFDQKLSGDDILNTSNRNTEYVNGVAYLTIGNIDQKGIEDYVNLQNKYSKTAYTSAGVLTGMSAGAALGVINPVLGLVGAGVGGLLGGLFSSSKASSLAAEREQAIKKQAENISESINFRNRASESSAATQGMRNMFYSGHAREADKGKSPMQDIGLASHDEGMIDMSTGETQYLGSANPMVKEPRKDNVPVGGPGFDDNVAIPGHLRDTDGVMFADKARPYFKANELFKIANQRIDAMQQENASNSKRDKNTSRFVEKKLNNYKQQTQQQYQQNSQVIADIVNRQSAMQEEMKRLSLLKLFERRQRNYDKGTWAKIGNGVNNVLSAINSPSRHGLASPLLGLYNGIRYASKAQEMANSNQPYAENSFVANSTAPAALNIMGNLRYDPSAELQKMNTTAAQNRYAINQAGNLSAGQRMMLSTAANNDLFSRRAEIMANARDKNNQYKQAYAQALMSHGASEAQRQQQALAVQQENYAKAVGAKQRLQEQANKNWYTVGQQALKDWNSAAMFNRTADLYDAQQGRAASVSFTPPTVKRDTGVTLPTLDTSTPEKVLETRLKLGLDCGKRARRFDIGTPQPDIEVPALDEQALAQQSAFADQAMLGYYNSVDQKLSGIQQPGQYTGDADLVRSALGTGAISMQQLNEIGEGEDINGIYNPEGWSKGQRENIVRAQMEATKQPAKPQQPAKRRAISKPAVRKSSAVTAKPKATNNRKATAAQNRHVRTQSYRPQSSFNASDKAYQKAFNQFKFK